MKLRLSLRKGGGFVDKKKTRRLYLAAKTAILAVYLIDRR